jgi:hypothetical protein
MTDEVLDRVTFCVESGKIAEFRRATLIQDPVHDDESQAHEAGFSACPAPPTYVVVAGHYRDQAAMVATLGLDLKRVVVGSVKWTYARALMAQDRLVGTRRVVGDERRTQQNGSTMRLVTLETEYLDAYGEPAVWVNEVIIERGSTS